MPVYGIRNGLREFNIGRLVLLNGLFAILFGTSLCEYVSKKLPLTLVTVITIPAIVNIFALTNIQTCYASLYRNTGILPSRAPGVYSVVEHISMAVGPIVFSYTAAENIAWRNEHPRSELRGIKPDFRMRPFTVILPAALFLFVLISGIFGLRGQQKT
jgi:hypothetical protein